MVWPADLHEFKSYESAIIASLGVDEQGLHMQLTDNERMALFKQYYSSESDDGPSDASVSKTAIMKVLAAADLSMLKAYTDHTKKRGDTSNNRTEYIKVDDLLRDMQFNDNVRPEHKDELQKAITTACASSSMSDTSKQSWRRSEDGVMYVPRTAVDVARNAVYYKCYEICVRACESGLAMSAGANFTSHAASTSPAPAAVHAGFRMPSADAHVDDQDNRIRIGDVLDDILAQHPECLSHIDEDSEDKAKMNVGRMMSKLERRKGVKRKRDMENQRVYTEDDRGDIEKFLISSLEAALPEVGAKLRQELAA